MLEIRILKKSDDRSSFSCGEIELDYFFQKYAGQNQFKHFIGTTYVATDNKEIFGFITVSVGHITTDELPKTLQKKFPNYPLPILHILRVGVDKKYQNQGIGKELIFSAFKLAIEQKNILGCIGVVVDAKKSAIKFYQKLGFVEIDIIKGLSKIRPLPTPMFLPIQTIQKAFQQAKSCM